MKPLKINIFFTSFSLNNTKGLINSLNEQIIAFPNNNYSLFLNVIFNGAENEFRMLRDLINYQSVQINLITNSEIKDLERKYIEFISDSNCNLNLNSIQRGRIQQQIYIKENYSKFKDSIVWQVDDDMLFKSFEIRDNKVILGDKIDYFGNLFKLYNERANSIDAIVAKSNYTPPIPSLLYTRNQLTDILKNNYVKRDVEENEEYHDYYFLSKEQGFYNIKLHSDESTNTLIKRVLNGQPITRPVIHKLNNVMSDEPFYLRGGNFIVFNTELFQTVSHLGFVFDKDEPARRSDMVHATLALKMGYKIVENHELILVHNRCFKEYSFEKNVQDYYNDIIGNLILIRLNKGIEEVNQRLSFHKSHIAEIITLFEEYVLKKDHKAEYEQLQSLKQLVDKLQWENLESKYNLFLEKYMKIINRKENANYSYRFE